MTRFGSPQEANSILAMFDASSEACWQRQAKRAKSGTAPREREGGTTAWGRKGTKGREEGNEGGGEQARACKKVRGGECGWRQ